MAHYPIRRTLSVPQEGGSSKYRSLLELSGNASLAAALDDNDSLQVNVVATKADGEVLTAATPRLKLKSLSTDFSVDPTDGFPIVVGDFLSVEGIDGFFVVSSFMTTTNPNDTLIIDGITAKLADSATGDIASNILTDGVSIFPGVEVGDRVDITTGKNKHQTYKVLDHTTATQLVLDGSPVDDTAFTYRISRPPTLIEFPLSMSPLTGLTFYVSRKPNAGFGAPGQTRLAGFGDASLSTVVNRAVGVLAQNTDYLKKIVESRIAFPRRKSFPSGHGLNDEFSIISTLLLNSVWTGKTDGSSTIIEVAKILDTNGFDLEVGGTTVIVTAIQDGFGGSSIFSNGFVRIPEDYADVVIKTNIAIPDTTPFFIMYGEGLSIEDVIVEEPETLLKSELVLAGTDDENLPELVTARTSDRFGAYTTLDARIEATEARTGFWFWIGADPEFTINLAGTSIAHQAVSISYEGTVYTVGASSFVIVAAAGFIKATLSGGVITFSVINATTFDPDTDLSATSVIVGAWHNASKTVYTLQGSVNEVITARSSARLGAQTHLDDRLEAIEARLNQWAWNDTDPDFRLEAANTVGHSAISISYNGSTFTLAAGTFSRSGTEGFVKARLENGTVVLSNLTTFDPDTDLTAGDGSLGFPVDIIVGSWESSSNIVHTRNLGGDVTMTREGDEIVGDGVLTGFGVTQQGSPDDTVIVGTGTAVIAGRKVRASVTQTLAPVDFTAAAVSRIDIVVLDSSGVASLVQGAESATPFIPLQLVTADNIILSYLYLRSSGAFSPPEDILTANNGTDSFILLNLQKFFVQRDDTDPHRHPANIAIDGAFLRSASLSDWTPTNGTFIQSIAPKIFGDFSGLFGATGGAGKVEQVVADITPLLGKWVTLSCYARLSAASTALARITIVVTGGTNSAATSNINNVLWQRTHITGFIHPSATAVTIRLELDSSGATTSGYFDGVQLSVGKIITEFEYPTRVFVNKDGSIDLPNSVLSGDVVINGSLTVTGAEDTEAAFLAWIAQ